jgi:hypothetical protein
MQVRRLRKAERFIGRNKRPLSNGNIEDAKQFEQLKEI